MNLRLKFVVSIVLLGLLCFMLPASIRADTVNINSINANSSPFFVDISTTNLLSQYGITLANVTPGTTVDVVCGQCGGNSIVSSSPPNLLTQNGNDNGMSYTLQFSTPLSTLSFTLAGNSKSGGSGTLVAGWSATASDASGNVISSVGDPSLFGTFSPFPPQPFTLTGPGIASVTFFTQCFNVCGTGLNIADLSAPEIKLQNTACQVNVVGVEMSDKETLEIDVMGQFSQNASSQKSFALMATLNGVNLSSTMPLAPGSVGTQTASFALNLAQNQVPRFTTNTQVSVTATGIDGQSSCQGTSAAVIRLPVVVVPGILNGSGGDHTFPTLENFLTTLSPSSPNVLEQPYALRQNPEAGTCGSIGTEVYPTLFTLSYDTSGSTFTEGARPLGICIDDIARLTYADKVSIVAHSKGGLVARAYLFRQILPTVDRLVLAGTPNAGALKAAWVELLGDKFVRLSDLLPVWPWQRKTASESFGIPAGEINAELDNLNGERLPSNVSYTIIYSSSVPTQLTRTGKHPLPFQFGLEPGDGVVPDFSAQGFIVDPNNNDETQIPAFVGIPVTIQQVAGQHRGYIESQFVMPVIASALNK